MLGYWIIKWSGLWSGSDIQVCQCWELPNYYYPIIILLVLYAHHQVNSFPSSSELVHEAVSGWTLLMLYGHFTLYSCLVPNPHSALYPSYLFLLLFVNYMPCFIHKYYKIFWSLLIINLLISSQFPSTIYKEIWEILHFVLELLDINEVNWKNLWFSSSNLSLALVKSFLGIAIPQ